MSRVYKPTVDSPGGYRPFTIRCWSCGHPHPTVEIFERCLPCIETTRAIWEERHAKKKD